MKKNVESVEETVEVRKTESAPTPEEAKNMFLENSGLSSVVTTEGIMFRHQAFKAV